MKMRRLTLKIKSHLGLNLTLRVNLRIFMGYVRLAFYTTLGTRSKYNFDILDLRHSNRNHILIHLTSKSQPWFKDCPMVDRDWASVDGPEQVYKMERDRFPCQVHLGLVQLGLVMERDRDSIYHSQNHHSQWTFDHNHLRNGFWYF